MLLGDEFLAYFPQWKLLFTHLKVQYDELIARVEKIYKEITSDPQVAQDNNLFGRASTYERF